MPLSSNSIIHFTKTRKALEGILRNNFKINYCRELVHARTGSFDILVPMVSFCDIPFSQIHKHIKSYGSYGIGLSKVWATEKGLNPVLYFEKESNLGHGFIYELFKSVVIGNPEIQKWTQQQKRLFDIARYSKNYQGTLMRHGKKDVPNYRFSDEREWRYVLPSGNPAQFIANCHKRPQDEISAKKIKLNNAIENERLFFNPNNINYIIIKNESERSDIIAALHDIKGGHDEVVRSRLASKIISVEQINTDF